MTHDEFVDAYRFWEKNHNRDNYGRFDAYKAGYELAVVHRQAMPMSNIPTMSEYERGRADALKQTRRMPSEDECSIVARRICKDVGATAVTT